MPHDRLPGTWITPPRGARAARRRLAPGTTARKAKRGRHQRQPLTDHVGFGRASAFRMQHQYIPPGRKQQRKNRRARGRRWGELRANMGGSTVAGGTTW